MIKKICTALACFTVLSNAAVAAIVDSGPLNVAVPANNIGIYYNVVTNVSSPTVAMVPGWDLNPYGPTAIQFFWPNTPATSSGGVATGTVFNNLADGTVVGPASTFAVATASTNTVNLQTSGPKIMGFRFFNEATSVINYGYFRMTTTAPAGHPATITQIIYQNDGTAITVAPAGGGGSAITAGTASGTTINTNYTLPTATGTATLAFTGSAAGGTMNCALSGTNAANYAVTPANPVAIGTVATNVTVTYNGSTAGTFTATLTCTPVAPATGGPFTYPLSAVVSPAAAGAAITPGLASGSAVAINYAPPANSGNSVLSFTASAASTMNCALSGANAAGFTTTPANPIAVGTTATNVTVSHTSAAAGAFTATLTCTPVAPATGGPFTYNLTATRGAAIVSVIPTLNWVGLLSMIAMVIGFGVFASRRHS